MTRKTAPQPLDHAPRSMAQRLGAILWPSFFAAGVATMVCFALIDPLTLRAAMPAPLVLARFWRGVETERAQYPAKRRLPHAKRDAKRWIRRKQPSFAARIMCTARDPFNQIRLDRGGEAMSAQGHSFTK